MNKVNISKFEEFFKEYKHDFHQNISSEIYKWRAVSHFQKVWNPHASDFAGMLAEAMSKTDNLLAANHYYPMEMLLRFCQTDVGKVRAMFENLYDETQEVFSRIEKFVRESEDLLQRRQALLENTSEKMHFQNLNSISTYLWLRYPSKYYICKYSVVKNAMGMMEYPSPIKSGLSPDNVLLYMEFYDEIAGKLQADDEFRTLLQQESDCRFDTQLHIAAIDFVYYLSNYYKVSVARKVREPHVWMYAPGENALKWENCIREGKMFLGWDELGDLSRYPSREAMRLKIQEAYQADGKSINDSLATWNFVHELQIGDVIFAKKGRSVILGRGVVTGEYCYDDTLGQYCNFRSVKWQITGEWTGLSKQPVKTLTDITSYPEYVGELNRLVETPDGGVGEHETDGYWWLISNPRIWSALNQWSVGEEQEYTLHNSNGNKRRIFQNFIEAKVGDKVVCYESTPTKQIVALAEVTRCDDKTIGFRKCEQLLAPIDYNEIRNLPELAQMEFFANPNGSFFKLTREEYNVLMDLIRENNGVPNVGQQVEAYDEKDFLEQVYISEEELHTLMTVLRRKKNIILQGAPGVGKTFTARRLAYVMMKGKYSQRVCMVQFHQNYSYEDFVMGYKPSEEGFRLKTGKFYNFCLQAENDPGNDYFFIIDEINRGNLSKIFGELLMAVECGYRGTKVHLAYSDKEFSVPQNLYIIGMMNTADRSLAMMDYALRRRFSFFKMRPGFETEGFKKKMNGNMCLKNLVDKVKQLNEAICTDASLGEGFQIGHSYFCADDLDGGALKSVVLYDILPMLEEYWFDNIDEYKKWSDILLKAVDDGR